MYSEKGLSGTHRTERTFGTGNKAGKSGKVNEFQNCFKKLVKKCWQERRGVVLYLSAKRRTKEWLLQPGRKPLKRTNRRWKVLRLRKQWIAPVGRSSKQSGLAKARWRGLTPTSSRLAPKNTRRSKFGKVQKLLKKDLTKNHFGGKINRSPVERLRRTGPWKLNNIEKLVTEPLCVWKNT